MKKTCTSLALLALFLLTAAGVQAQSPVSNFTGNWMLDLSKTDTNKDFPQKLKNFKMAVSGDESNLNVKSQIEGNVIIESAGRGATTGVTESASRIRGNDAVTGPGSSAVGAPNQINYGGTMALFFNVNNAVYNVNGEEKKVETPEGWIRVKAKADKSGKVLQFTIIRPIKTPNGVLEVTTREIWKLAEDGKSMRLQRTVESNNWRDQIVMVLNKVG